MCVNGVGVDEEKIKGILLTNGVCVVVWMGGGQGAHTGTHACTYFNSSRLQTFSPEPKCSSSLVGLKSNTSSLVAWHAAYGNFSRFVILVLRRVCCQC